MLTTARPLRANPFTPPCLTQLGAGCAKQHNAFKMPPYCRQPSLRRNRWSSTHSRHTFTWRLVGVPMPPFRSERCHPSYCWSLFLPILWSLLSAYPLYLRCPPSLVDSKGRDGASQKSPCSYLEASPCWSRPVAPAQVPVTGVRYIPITLGRSVHARGDLWSPVGSTTAHSRDPPSCSDKLEA